MEANYCGDDCLATDDVGKGFNHEAADTSRWLGS